MMPYIPVQLVFITIACMARWHLQCVYVNSESWLSHTHTHKYCTCFCTHHNLLPYGGCNSMDVGQKTCVCVCVESPARFVFAQFCFAWKNLEAAAAAFNTKKFGQTIHMQCSALHNSTWREYKVVGVNIVLHTGRYLLLSY